MENSKIKNWIIITLAICLALLSTCEFCKTKTSENPTTADTLFHSQWRHEKSAKLEIIKVYSKQVKYLQIQADSLHKIVNANKLNLFTYRLKTKSLQEQLRNDIKKMVRLDSLSVDSITPVLDSLITYQVQSDSTCDVTINELENIVANRDSTILFQRSIENNLRDLEKEEELRNQYLTEQLTIAYKAQRKKSKQNKLLAGGLLILSGITTSILITHSLK